MATSFLLPCECGKKLRVENSQAGHILECECGRRIEVPTFRGLQRLERVSESSTSASYPSSTWGPRQALMLLGGLIVLASIGWQVYLGWEMQQRIEKLPDPNANAIQLPDELTAAASWRAWKQLQQGLRENPATSVRPIVEHREQWRWAAYGTLGAGFVIIIVGLLLPTKRTIVK